MAHMCNMRRNNGISHPIAANMWHRLATCVPRMAHMSDARGTYVPHMCHINALQFNLDLFECVHVKYGVVFAVSQEATGCLQLL